MTQYQALRMELESHLIDSGLTYSIEDGTPTVMRPVPVKLVLDTLLDYMIGAGYASERKIG